jgi:hypothetical protein
VDGVWHGAVEDLFEVVAEEHAVVAAVFWVRGRYIGS